MKLDLLVMNKVENIVVIACYVFKSCLWQVRQNMSADISSNFISV